MASHPTAEPIQTPDEALAALAALPREQYTIDPGRPQLRLWPSHAPWLPTLPETTLWFNLEASATRYPDKVAFIDGARRTSYRALHARALALAGFLQRRAGVARCDRVLLFMPNSADFVACSFAVARADAVLVPVNVMNREDEFAHYLTDAEAAAVLTTDALAPVAEAALAALRARGWTRPVTLLHGASLEAAIAAGLQPEPARNGPDDLAVMPYTSGTTGFPKGCMHTHRTVMHNVVSIAVWSKLHADIVSLAAAPMFHVTGFMICMQVPVYLGASVVNLPRWDRDEACRLIAEHRVTHWTNIPTMVIDILASPRLAEYDLSSLKQIGGGGAGMPQAVAARLKQLTGLDYLEGYGLTETIAPSHYNPADAPKQQCLGVPYCGVDARVVDADTLVELPPGQTGEIVIRGPQVFKGYWRRPEATRAAFVELDGRRFFRSGDLGHVDDEGYFFITDRLKRMINASGYKVWPAEVEALLYRHPDIAEACIIAAPDAYRGQTVKAVVVPKPHARATLTEQALIDWARAHMAVYKAPRIVQFVDALPKSGSGKVQWRALQEAEFAARA